MQSIHSINQKGSILLESLVGIIIVGIVGLGMTFLSWQTIKNQKLASSQNLVVQEIRHQMQNQGVNKLCSDSAEDIYIYKKNESTDQNSTEKLKFQKIGNTINCDTDVEINVVVDGNPSYNHTFTSTIKSIHLETTAEVEKMIGPGSIVIQQ